MKWNKVVTKKKKQKNNKKKNQKTILNKITGKKPEMFLIKKTLKNSEKKIKLKKNRNR
jgi:hypothetical protein